MCHSGGTRRVQNTPMEHLLKMSCFWKCIYVSVNTFISGRGNFLYCMCRPKCWYQSDHMDNALPPFFLWGKGRDTNKCSGWIFHFPSWCMINWLSILMNYSVPWWFFMNTVSWAPANPGLSWGNRLAASGRILRGELQHPPIKKLSRSSSR